MIPLSRDKPEEEGRAYKSGQNADGDAGGAYVAGYVVHRQQEVIFIEDLQRALLCRIFRLLFFQQQRSCCQRTCSFFLR